MIREIKVTSEEELAHDSSEERAVIGNTEVEKAEANRAIELSINSVVGLTTLGTIKLNYKLGQRRKLYLLIMEHPINLSVLKLFNTWASLRLEPFGME